MLPVHPDSPLMASPGFCFPGMSEKTMEPEAGGTITVTLQAGLSGQNKHVGQPGPVFMWPLLVSILPCWLRMLPAASNRKRNSQWLKKAEDYFFPRRRNLDVWGFEG